MASAAPTGGRDLCHRKSLASSIEMSSSDEVPQKWLFATDFTQGSLAAAPESRTRVRARSRDGGNSQLMPTAHRHQARRPVCETRPRGIASQNAHKL